MAVTRAKPATLGDLLGLDDHDRLEIINGEIVEKTVSSVDHAYVERKLGGLVDPFTYRSGSPKGPGGWWIFTEIHTWTAVKSIAMIWQAGGARGCRRDQSTNT